MRNHETQEQQIVSGESSNVQSDESGKTQVLRARDDPISNLLTEAPHGDKRYNPTLCTVGWTDPPGFAPAEEALNVWALQKTRLPSGEGCSAESNSSE